MEFIPEHIHPIIVHFPIALFVTALGLQVASLILKKESLHSAAILIYVLATCVAPFVVWTGLEEAEHLNLVSHPVLNLHRRFALITLWGSLATLPVLWFLKRRNVRNFQMIFLLVVIVIAFSVSITAYHGGRMVYEYGVGVEE